MVAHPPDHDPSPAPIGGSRLLKSQSAAALRPSLSVITDVLPADVSTGGASDEGGDNTGRVPVQAAPGPLWRIVGLRVGLVHVAQRDPQLR
jgi:hypothetical protein